MDTLNPLAHGNRFQRAYYRWALPYYERFGRQDPALRERVELADVYLYTRRGVGAWVGWWLVLAGAAAGLHSRGVGAWQALLVAGACWTVVSCVLLGAWIIPTQMIWRKFARGLVTGLLAGTATVAVMHLNRHGPAGFTDPAHLVRLKGALVVGLPAGVGMLLLVFGIARAGRSAREHQLARLQLVAERDAAARSAAEADLRLLQAQIHPHFVFNTLATLQHWVDGRDERAGPLLRELSGFLRRSTEMLGRPTVPLSEEAQAVRHYLAILSARLEGRVQGDVDIDPALAAEPLPPGLLLTLVENAVEHGLEPKIGGGRLWVSASPESPGYWRLRVDDDGLGLAADAADDVGLSNLRQRLKHHFGARARFTLQARAEGGTRAEIFVSP